MGGTRRKNLPASCKEHNKIVDSVKAHGFKGRNQELWDRATIINRLIADLRHNAKACNYI